MDVTASSPSSRARKTRVSAEYIANVLANESSGEEDLDDLFAVDNLLEDKHHNDWDWSSDGADIDDEQTDRSLLKQNAVTTYPSMEILPDSPPSSTPPKCAQRQEHYVSSSDKSLDPDNYQDM